MAPPPETASRPWYAGPASADNGRFPEDPMANREQRSNREKKKPKQPNKPAPVPGTPQPWKK